MVVGAFKVHDKKMEKDKGGSGEGVCKEYMGKEGKGVYRLGLLLQTELVPPI